MGAKNSYISSLLKCWRLQISFLLLPGIVFINAIYILICESSIQTAENTVNILGFFFNLKYDAFFYQIYQFTLVLSFLLMLFPSMLILILGLLQKRSSNDIKSINQIYNFGILIISSMLIIRGVNSIFGLYVISKYHFNSPMTFMVIFWSFILIMNAFTLKQISSSILKETGHKLYGIVEESPNQLIEQFNYEKYTFVVGIKPEMKIINSPVYLPHHNTTVHQAIYIGISLLHLLNNKEVINYIDSIKKQSTPIQDWCQSCRNVKDNVQQTFGKNKIPPIARPVMHFIEFFLQAYEIKQEANQEKTTHCKTSIKIALINEIWQRKVLPTLNAKLHLGRKHDYWCMSLVDEIRGIKDKIYEDILETIENNFNLNNDSTYKRETLFIGLAEYKPHQEKKSLLSELDKNATLNHIKQLTEEGRVGA